MVFLSYLDIMPFLHKGNNWVYNAYENLILYPDMMHHDGRKILRFFQKDY